MRFNKAIIPRFRKTSPSVKRQMIEEIAVALLPLENTVARFTPKDCQHRRRKLQKKGHRNGSRAGTKMSTIPLPLRNPRFLEASADVNQKHDWLNG